MREISSNALPAFHSNVICRTFIPALSIRKLAVWALRELENSVLREIRITILFRTGAGMRGFFESNARQFSVTNEIEVFLYMSTRLIGYRYEKPTDTQRSE